MIFVHHLPNPQNSSESVDNVSEIDLKPTILHYKSNIFLLHQTLSTLFNFPLFLEVSTNRSSTTSAKLEGQGQYPLVELWKLQYVFFLLSGRPNYAVMSNEDEIPDSEEELKKTFGYAGHSALEGRRIRGSGGAVAPPGKI